MMKTLLLLIVLSWATQGYELVVEMEDMPMQGPLNKPGHIEEKWGSIDAWKNGDAVVYLNDDNFEHLTQCASGWTTGDWFVMFGAPWCEYCEEMMLNWNYTAQDLKGEVNVAVVDASNNPFTSLRFNITGYPTVFLLHHGRAYKYEGPRYWKNLVVFARLEYADAPSFEIPPAHGSFDALVHQMQKYSGDIYRLYERRPYLFFGSIIGGIFFGCLLPYAYILSAPMDPDFLSAKSQGGPSGPKIWSAKPVLSTITEEPIVEDKKSSDDDSPKMTASASQTSIQQVEVDADTVEIVTDQDRKATSRKANKKNKKKN